MAKEKIKKFGIGLFGDMEGVHTSWGIQPCGKNSGRDDFGAGIGENGEPVIKLGDTVISDSELASISRKNTYDRISKHTDYLYEVFYNDINYKYGNAFMRERYGKYVGGACTSIRKGNYYGRNYDWLYSESASFVVRVPAIDGRHASVGVTGAIKELTNEFVQSGAYSEVYNALPFVLMDGINDSGVVCSINVVPAGDMGFTTGTHPELKDADLCQVMIPRFVLDNFSTAKEAAEYIRDKANVYGPAGANGAQEIHVMIADKDNTYVLEFVDVDGVHQCVILEPEKPYMTNFYLYNTSTLEDGTIDISTVTPFASGVERYNIIAAEYDGVNDRGSMRELMDKLAYTHAYDKGMNPFWKTEFVGDYTDSGHGIYTVDTPIEEMTEIIDAAIEQYNQRDRSTGSVWQTVHSSVYDIENKTLSVVSQERSDYPFFFGFTPNMISLPDARNLKDGQYVLAVKVENGVPVLYCANVEIEQ